MRVMSVNQCTDQLVMLLLPPERIASITYLGGQAAVTPELAAKARLLKANHGLTEEALAEKPDLIVAGLYTTTTLRKLAKQTGIPVIELEAAEDFDAIRAQTLQLGEAFGEQARARAVVARMDATLAELKRSAPPQRIVAVGWNGGGRVVGRKSLFDAILTAAGGHNSAADGGAFERTLDLEQLLSLKPQPDLLLYGGSSRPGLAAQHPALIRAYGPRRLPYAEDAYQCGTPYAADEAVALRRAMLAALRLQKGGPP
jgi:iron complex transport system substrate-binding protein